MSKRINVNKKVAFNRAVEFVELQKIIKTLKDEGGSSLIEKFEKDCVECHEVGWRFLVLAAEEFVEAEAQKKKGVVSQ